MGLQVVAAFYAEVDGLLLENNSFLHFCTSSGVTACFWPGVVVPVATWVMVTAVAGMS